MIHNLDLLKKSLIRIENIKTWLVDIPKLHPDHERYSKLWSFYTKFSIEGLWGFDNGGWRYMPGTLFFYGNFFSILDIDEKQKVRRYVRPTIRDIDWMIHYAYLEAQGFSGWSKDDEFTSNYKILNCQSILDTEGNTDLITSKGALKKFIHPKENIKKLHDKDMGVPLYGNSAKNIMLFGSRGGGKSFSFAGIAAHHITFDGLKYFTQEDYDNPPTIEVCVGSGGSEKSSEFCTKIEEGLKSFGTDNNLGAWGRADRGDEDYTPNPFYRDWEGSIGVGNKKNPFRYEYSAKINERWIKGLGTKTKLIHVNYSDKKQGGEAAAAGGRYVLHIYEEVGLMSNAVDTWFSNVGTITDSYGQQFGVQVAIGTSGVIELVQQSKKIFSNPADYNCLEYEDIWENSGKIGFFLPSYMTNSKFKDKNGNTDVEAALEFYVNRRLDAAKSNDPENLRNEKMNFPIVPSDMWISSKGHHFPFMELAEREKALIKKGLFRTFTPTKLIWDTTKENEIKAEPDLEAEPFYEFPYSSSMSKLDGAVVIYQQPEKIDGEIPKDMYFFVLDPYVADAIDEGGSLGALYGFVNPKYGAKYNGGTMVCSYVGKHPNGRDGYYENVEKILAYYGNCTRSLWYEANRGDSVRGYFVRRNKTHLLAIRPEREKGSSIYAKRALDFGIMVNGIDDKLQMIGDAADYMLQPITYDGKEMRFVETLPDIFLVRQCMSFELKKHKNFDAVSAFIMAPFVMKELRHETLKEIEKQTKHNPVTFLSMNPYQFKKEDTLRRLEKFKHKYEEQDKDY